jgi:hypothetical protein
MEMLRGITRIGIAAAFMLAVGPARAQNPPPAAPDPAKVTVEVSETQEDILLIRVISALKLTTGQMMRLIPTLESAQTKLKAQDVADAKDLKARQTGLEAARKQVLAGGAAAGPRAEQDYQQTLVAIQKRRATLRASLVQMIRRALTGLLTQEQMEKMAQVGQEMQFLQRQAQWMAQAQSGDGGGGPLAGMTRMMDRMRDVPPAEWEKAKTDMAQRMAGGGGGFGGPGGPGGPGGGGGRGGRGGNNQARQQQQMARMQNFMQMADQVRSLPSDQYESQKFSIAGKLFQNMRGGGQQSPDDAINGFIDRYFLSPRIVPAMKDKSGVPAAASR